MQTTNTDHERIKSGTNIVSFYRKPGPPDYYLQHVIFTQTPLTVSGSMGLPLGFMSTTSKVRCKFWLQRNNRVTVSVHLKAYGGEIEALSQSCARETGVAASKHLLVHATEPVYVVSSLPHIYSTVRPCGKLPQCCG